MEVMMTEVSSIAQHILFFASTIPMYTDAIILVSLFASFI